MKRIIVTAAIALAACTPPAQEAAPEAAAPQSLMEQAQAMAPEQGPVFAMQQLMAYQAAHPEVTPTCTSVRVTESRGVIPAEVAPTSFYASYVGSLVYSVQCGPQLTGTRMDPREHWLVVLAPGATDPVVVNCATPAQLDQCPQRIPLATATPEAAKTP